MEETQRKVIFVCESRQKIETTMNIIEKIPTLKDMVEDLSDEFDKEEQIELSNSMRWNFNEKETDAYKEYDCVKFLFESLAMEDEKEIEKEIEKRGAGFAIRMVKCCKFFGVESIEKHAKNMFQQLLSKTGGDVKEIMKELERPVKPELFDEDGKFSREKAAKELEEKMDFFNKYEISKEDYIGKK